jgi:type VI secretion system FHA domain protein
MYLTLEVVSSQAPSLGASSRQVVGPAGLTIGRAIDNDWVLPDPYISKQHARILFDGDQFLVEGLGRNPIAVGRADNAIPTRQPRPLRVGDRIFIDQYEVLVTLLEDEQATAPAMEDGPVTERLTDAGGPLAPQRYADEEPYGEPGASAHEEPAPSMGWRSSPASGPPQGRRSPAPEPVPPPPPMSAPGSAGGTRPGLRPVRPVPSAADAARAPAPGRAPTPLPPPRQAPGVMTGPSRTLTPRSPPPRPSATRTAPGTHGAFSGDLGALLQAAGVSEHDFTPELAHELGQVLRISIEGVMEMLHARAEIKAAFQLPLTRVQSKENNPLKLMPNVESVLHTLLVQRNAAYLPAVQAFEDAIDDIRNHQAALLAGLRAAFDSVLASFDPENLQSQFEAAGKRGGLLGLSGKSRNWEQYTEHYQRLGSDSDESFRRLCGEVFAEAYEQHLERGKRRG